MAEGLPGLRRLQQRRTLILSQSLYLEVIALHRHPATGVSFYHTGLAHRRGPNMGPRPHEIWLRWGLSCGYT
jgi:hypothetical protein